MIFAGSPLHRTLSATLHNVRARWALMTLYERFEQLVALALSLIIAILILIALVQLYQRVLPLVLGGALDPLDHEVFQASRKFVILDAGVTPAATILALAAVTLVLGAVYWLLRDQGQSD